MDSLITAAARALAAGDPLGALKRIALRDDAPARALQSIAMAQLGDLVRAKALVRSAARAFGPKEAVARARCVVAEAEIALVSRDLGWPARALDAARATLEEHGDRVNAAHARYLEVRRLLLIGRIDEAERTLAELDPALLPPASRTVHELVVAGIALRRLRTKAARAALATRAVSRSQQKATRGWRAPPPAPNEQRCGVRKLRTDMQTDTVCSWNRTWRSTLVTLPKAWSFSSALFSLPSLSCRHLGANFWLVARSCGRSRRSCSCCVTASGCRLRLVARR